MESTKNEFCLIVTWKMIRRYSKDGVNRSIAQVMRAVKKANLVEQSLITPTSTDVLSPHITALRLLNTKEYVAGGCVQNGYACAILSRETTGVIRQVAANNATLHNFICYGNFVVGSDHASRISVFDLNSGNKVQLPDCFLSTSHTGAQIGFNCGRHMETDDSIGYVLCTYEYLSVANSFLMRFDFRDFKESKFDESVSTLEREKLYESAKLDGFCLSKRFVYVIDNQKIVRINKKTKVKSVFSSHTGKEASLIPTVYQIAANDHFVYGCSQKYLVLIKLLGDSIRALAKADCPKVGSDFYRCVKMFTYKGVTYISVGYESPFGISLYVHYHHRLFTACSFQDSKETTNRCLSFTVDERHGRLIVCKEHGKSTILRLAI